jgi:hypothetical protein
MHQRSLLATGTWVAIGLSTWTVAWVIAESIPVFNELLSLIVRTITPFQVKCVANIAAECSIWKLVQL